MFHRQIVCLVFVIIYLINHPPLSCDSPFASLSSSLSTTATAQFAYLNTIPFSVFLTSPRSRFISTQCLFLSILIALSGDIELNPGPASSKFNVCTFNIRSFTNPLHYTALADLAYTYSIDLFALTETWVSSNTTSAELLDATPPGFTLISNPRPVSSSTISSVVGGGTAFLIRQPCTLLTCPTPTFNSFEISGLTLKLSKSKFTVYNIYRPPISQAKSRIKSSFSQFLDDFQCFISSVATLSHDFLITGDFNIHVDDLSDNYSQQFLSILSHANLTQHVPFPTHRHNHTLDLVITSADSSLSPVISYTRNSSSDHFPVFSSLNITPPKPSPLSKHSFRSIKSINIHSFILDILSSNLITHPPTNLSDLVDCYNSTLSSILNKHAPVKTKILRLKPTNPWFTPALNKLKRARRHLERIWSRSHSSHDLIRLRSATNHYHAAIIKAKRDYNSKLISSATTNSRKLWTTVNNFLHRKSSPVLPSYHCLKSLSHSFATFFSDKIHKLHTNLLLKANYSSPHIDPPFNPVNLSNFQPVTLDEVSKLLSQSPATDSDLDPIPTSLLKQCACVLLPTITNIINLSLSSGTFPDQFKSCSVHPLLKKPNLDKEILGNYRPVSHLSFLSKLIERIVKNRLMDHLSSYKLLNSFQSAYLKSHSTETALLSVHDHIIRAMSLQQITCLCLLDLSAAFDTIDHSILIHRLTSWFGINGSVLSWLKSYLSNRSFYVNLTGTKSSIFQLLYGVPQGSVLGPLLFILYTTPLSHIISKSASNHHLYADDTQLYMSFSPNYFSSNITHLEGTISSINDWMSANFLSLNPDKTEFLLIGHPKQLSKLDHPTLSLPDNVILSPAKSARNLGVIFDSNLSFTDHISAISKSCLYHIRDLKRIRSTIDQSTARIIATALIHSKLDYCNSLLLNLPASHLNRLQLVLNSAARAVTRTSKFRHISPILKDLHWLKINERVHYKVLSLTYKILSTNQPSYLRTLLDIQTVRSTRSSSIITLIRPSNPSRLKLNNRSFYHQAPALWNSLPADLRIPSDNFLTTCSISNSSPFALSAPNFHKKLKTFLFYHSFPP